MKKTVFYLFVIFLMTVFACNSGKKADSKTTDSASAQKKEVTSKTEVKLSPDEQKKLNTFFSNFSEIFLESFTENQLNDKILIRFGVFHQYVNSPSCFKNAGNNKVKIKDLQVNLAAEKYFGRNIITHLPVDEIEYKEGFYFIPQAAGEAHQFSQVEKLMQLEGENFEAIVVVYVGETKNPHSTEAEWKKAGEEITISCKMKAKIQKITSEDNVSRYILKEYVKL